MADEMDRITRITGIKQEGGSWVFVGFAEKPEGGLEQVASVAHIDPVNGVGKLLGYENLPLV